MNRILALALGSLMMGGCSSMFPQHTCKLSDNGQTCTSMSDAYKAAKNASGGRVQTTTDSVLPYGSSESPSRAGYAVRPDGSSWQPPAHQETFQGFAQPQETGSPVYTPPRVHRAWAAPWTDAEGRLHGGEYQYFTTAGGWNYGSLKTAGQAGSAMMGPLRPGQVGFKVSPVDNAGKPVQKDNAAASSAAKQPPIAPKTPGVQAPAVREDKRAYSSAARAVGNVTQPYTQFGEDEEAR